MGGGERPGCAPGEGNGADAVEEGLPADGVEDAGAEKERCGTENGTKSGLRKQRRDGAVGSLCKGAGKLLTSKQTRIALWLQSILIRSVLKQNAFWNGQLLFRRGSKTE